VASLYIPSLSYQIASNGNNVLFSATFVQDNDADQLNSGGQRTKSRVLSYLYKCVNIPCDLNECNLLIRMQPTIGLWKKVHARAMEVLGRDQFLMSGVHAFLRHFKTSLSDISKQSPCSEH
jgi:hypothetical protein